MRGQQHLPLWYDNQKHFQKLPNANPENHLWSEPTGVVKVIVALFLLRKNSAIITTLVRMGWLSNSLCVPVMLHMEPRTLGARSRHHKTMSASTFYQMW